MLLSDVPVILPSKLSDVTNVWIFFKFRTYNIASWNVNRGELGKETG